MFSSRILPQIFNGTNQLIISETLSFIPKDGVKIIVPVSTQSSEITRELNIQFIFVNEDNAPPALKHSTQNNNMQLTLVNFNNPLGTGTTSPVHFTFGGNEYLLLFLVKCLIDQSNLENVTYTMTFSIYSKSE